MAEWFMAEGDRVAICDADPKAVAGFAEAYPDHIACVADVTDEAQMQAVFDHACATLALSRKAKTRASIRSPPHMIRKRLARRPRTSSLDACQGTQR